MKKISMQFDLGLDYAPANFLGSGLRVAYVEDVDMDFSYDAEL